MKTKAVTLHALSTVLKSSKNSPSPKVIKQNICLTQAKNVFKLIKTNSFFKSYMKIIVH